MAKSQNLSTGPTSEEGKAISCQNSTKHGLTSVKLNTPEEQSLYEAMVASVIEELNPQGMTEVNLVSDMAMIRIRLNRFDKAENALFFIEQDKKATPLTLGVMCKLQAVCDDGIVGLRNRLLLQLGYESMRRRSEICAFRFDDVKTLPNGKYALLLRKSKTDQFGEGKLIPSHMNLSRC